MQFMSFFQDWHQHIDIEGTVLKKVLKLLQSESHILSGIYPRILPLCHKIPKVHLKPFYTDFLDALRNGLNTYVPKSSRHQNTQFQNQQNGALNCVQAFFEVSIFGLKNDDDQLVHDLIGNKVRGLQFFLSPKNVAQFSPIFLLICIEFLEMPSLFILKGQAFQSASLQFLVNHGLFFMKYCTKTLMERM